MNPHVYNAVRNAVHAAVNGAINAGTEHHRASGFAESLVDSPRYGKSVPVTPFTHS